MPEQFWNCAEVKILPGTPPVVVNPPPAPVPVINTVPVENSVENVGTSPAIALPSAQSNNNIHSSAGSHGKTIVGYYASWQWYDRNKKAAPENMDFRKVQRVNFAFFQIDTQETSFNAKSPQNLSPGRFLCAESQSGAKYIEILHPDH